MFSGLIRRFNAAMQSGTTEVVVCCTGMPRREFLFKDDMAYAYVYLRTRDDDRYDGLLAAGDGMNGWPPVNIGWSDSLTIADFARAVVAATGLTGATRFDPSHPDRTLRKLLDRGHLAAAGWRPRTSLRDGLACAVAGFCATAAAG